MGADGGSAQTRYIFDALESIRLAKFSEEQFEYEAASKLYDTAVHLFITGVQKDGNKERQDLVRKKLAKCLAKAEKCRSIVRKQQNQTKNSDSKQNLNAILDDEEDEDDDLLVGVDGKRVEDYLSQKDSLGRHFNQDHTEWPHNLNMYQLKQVITSDIWLVARIVDKHDKNLAIMVGVPRINKTTQKPINNNSAPNQPALANQETIEAIDTSQMPHYELGKALSLRIAAIMYRPNRYHITTGQKFLQEFITDICLEIRTQYTIFCIVKATKETLEYARSVRGLVTNMRHADCKDAASMCQACQLRQTQRNIIRFSSSSSGSSVSSSEDTADGKTRVSRNNSQKKVNKRTKVTRKLSQEEVRKSLAAKLESESGLSSSNTNSRNVAKNFSSNGETTSKPATTPATTNNKKCSPSGHTTTSTSLVAAAASPSPTSSSSARRVSTPIIVLNSSKIREKTRAYEKRKSAGSSDGETVSSNPNSTPTTSGICTTASSSNSTSRCASSDSNASTQKPDYAETRTVREQKITKPNTPKCDEVIDLVGQIVIEQ